ncbi:response regulator transcription factor [Labrys wisconsinensis]|uniref:DNA-binding response OmpR family regulator n=1 Tax=Labrys wisconsinensis TaxID=425677 RepID=A0ABU0J4A9_9HYPH|nr:response regulator transcription factor [Labrys wisconsinensis]MDQ0469101.1 DNA-binding response OmpR family regulator [Labrys wisconsinensis]
MRILVAEDERAIVADIRRSLEAHQYVVSTVFDGEEALFAGAHEVFDLVILDLGLPKLDGLSVLRRWRSAGRGMPVIILTARDDWRDKVDGMDSGADDYLTKPFRMEELLARVRALVRRAAGQSSPVLSNGVLELDTRQRIVSFRGSPVQVTPLEYRLLAYLLHNAGRVVSQGQITESIYDEETEHGSNALEVVVARLRRKLDGSVIQTRRGQGYVIPNEHPPS